MSSDAKPDRFIFVNAPTIINAGPRDARRKLRSQLMRRVYFKKYKVPSQLEEIIDGIGVEPAKEIPQCRCKAPLVSSSKTIAHLLDRNHSRSKTADSSSPRSPLDADLPAALCERCGGHWRRDPMLGRPVLEQEKQPISASETSTRASSLHDIGAGRVDPFHEPGDIQDAPNSDQLIGHYARIVVPALRCSEDWVRAMYGAYIQGTQSPLLFHTLCLCGSVHLERLMGSNRSERSLRALEQTHYRYTALRELRQALSKPVVGTKTFDEIVVCICLLAISDPLGEMIASYRKSYNPFSHPLQSLGGLNVYGAGPIHAVHWNGLLALIQQNGGFHTLTLYGAKWKLSYSSLKYALHTATKPVFPVVDGNGNELGHRSPLEILDIAQMRLGRKLGDGFRRLHQFHIRESIIRTFLDLADLAQGMQVLIPESDDATIRDRICDARNLVEYRYLNLPLPTDVISSIVDCSYEIDRNSANFVRDLYRACWLTGGIFTTHVTFALPAGRRFRENLVPKLIGAILSCGKPVNTEIAKLLLWCTVIGGIAAEDVDLDVRPWYAERLRRLCIELSIRTWSEVPEIMRSFAWTDIACDHGGRKLWDEARIIELDGP